MMKIIDVHAHLGDDCVFDHHITEEDLLEGYRGTFVEGAIVQPLSSKIFFKGKPGNT